MQKDLCFIIKNGSALTCHGLPPHVTNFEY